MFGVEVGKFFGFLLTETGIKANPEKCAAIIGMRSPVNVKEIQQLTERMPALSRFLSTNGDKKYPYFQCLKKNNCFVWTGKCEKAFIKLEKYLASPLVLCKPLPSTLIRLYFSFTDRAISSGIVQDQDKV